MPNQAVVSRCGPRVRRDELKNVPVAATCAFAGCNDSTGRLMSTRVGVSLNHQGMSDSGSIMEGAASCDWGSVCRLRIEWVNLPPPAPNRD